MSQVEELLEWFGGAKFLSTLDLTKGYLQISLRPNSQAKTAFPTPFGLFQFVTMPFRLHGAAARFQWLMNQILQSHDQYAADYINNIVIYSASWEDHLTNILQALKKAGLTVNPANCHFWAKGGDLLGEHSGGGKLQPLVDKVHGGVDPV
ncbi:unnamed protein product [Caretta caretta]